MNMAIGVEDVKGEIGPGDLLRGVKLLASLFKAMTVPGSVFSFFFCRRFVGFRTGFSPFPLQAFYLVLYVLWVVLRWVARWLGVH